jgi:hypothetical protein
MTMRPGYYRDAESWLYLTAAGDLHLVADADTGPEPAWRKIDPPPPEDAEPKAPDAEDLAEFEWARADLYIAE